MNQLGNIIKFLSCELHINNPRSGCLLQNKWEYICDNIRSQKVYRIAACFYFNSLQLFVCIFIELPLLLACLTIIYVSDVVFNLPIMFLWTISLCIVLAKISNVKTDRIFKRLQIKLCLNIIRGKIYLCYHNQS